MNTYPANLLLKKKRCLLVGGGKIASRKLAALIDADADILLVAPSVNAAIASYEERGLLKVERRPFCESDLDKQVLVFAATDDRALNARVVALCTERAILCCAIDENWVDGSFITPASFLSGTVRVAISSDGVACRKTKLVKESLSRHLALIEDAELTVIGTDHNYLDMEKRAPLHFVGSRFDETGEMLSQVWGIHEFMIINTCNRLEIVAVISPSASLERIVRRITGFDALGKNDYYVKYGREAFDHMVLTSSGLYSQTPGEKHIVAQMKDAFRFAQEKSWAGPMLQEALDSCLHVAGHVRTEIEPLLKACEIEDLASSWIDSQTSITSDSRILIIGTGMLGKELLNRFAGRGAEIFWAYHVYKPQTYDIPCERVNICRLDELEDVLPSADIIISAASSPEPCLHQGHAPFMNRKGCIAVDLGIPRNIASVLKELVPGLSLADLDDLKHWFRREMADIDSLRKTALRNTTEHVGMYEKFIANIKGRNKDKSSGPDSN